jgi:hypothetical protein
MARRWCTICLPARKHDHLELLDSPTAFRRWVDQAFRDSPELLSAAFARGYRLKDVRRSARLGIRIRRIRCTATRQAFSVRPSFALPDMAGLTDQAEGPLFLRTFGVPFWALARVLGENPMRWSRRGVGLGRPGLVGPTLRKAELPSTCGQKHAIATTVGAGRAPDRRGSARRLRRRWEGARGQVRTAWVREQVRTLCGRAGGDGEAYRQPGGHRTGNRLDRVMRPMSRYPEDGQHLPGGEQAAGRHGRAWAWVSDFRPWNPATARANGGGRSPAGRVNRHRYHDDWPHNLLVSASLAGCRVTVHTPRS